MALNFKTKRSGRLIGGLLVSLLVCAIAWNFLLDKAMVEISATRVSSRPMLPDLPLASDYPELQTLSDLKKSWTILFFGFLNCPDICPTNLAMLAKAYADLKENRKYARVVFISVDPERDSVEAIKSYVEQFSPGEGFYGVTMHSSDLSKLSQMLGVYFSKENHGKVIGGESESYSMAHSGDLFLINPSLQWEALYRPPFEAMTISEDLRRLVLKGRF